jgi:hypothetical protein
MKKVWWRRRYRNATWYELRNFYIAETPASDVCIRSIEAGWLPHLIRAFECVRRTGENGDKQADDHDIRLADGLWGRGDYPRASDNL